MITLTEAAAQEFRKRIDGFNRGFDTAENNPCLAKAIRVGVQGGGCSGFEYVLQMEVRYNPETDHLEEHRFDVKTVVDQLSAIYLDGVTIDYSVHDLSGGFIFLNPTAKSTCGCGKSFSA
jgi:iron-sulfur cluster assembly protein